MARKSFSVNVDPHEAEVGDHVLRFVPEVGTEFLDMHQELRELQSKTTDENDPAAARESLDAAREFLAKLAEPETATLIRDPEFKLPIRILTQLITWLTGLYTGSDADDEAPAGKAPANGPVRTGRRNA